MQYSKYKGEIKMLDKILKNKLYLGLSVAGIAVIIAAIVLVCVFACGSDEPKAADENSAAVDEPIFEFEAVMQEEEDTYPVNFISASDFYAEIESNSDYTDRLIKEEDFAGTEAKLHHLVYVEVSGSDLISSRNGSYLEVGSMVYDVNYTNCEVFDFDIDGDGENEKIFYTCEIFDKSKRQVCTYYVIDGGNTVSWCRYNRAWAVGAELGDANVSASNTDASWVEVVVPEEGSFFVSLMIAGVDHEVYGRLACDNSGEKPFYYIDAGDYTDLLERMDGLDK